MFYYPRDPSVSYIKRVIGLPGDRVEIRSGTVYVNETAIEEPYLLPEYRDRYDMPETLVENGLLITEGARGEGAHLINGLGERFMDKYAPNKLELASRDVVSRAEQTEINEGRGFPNGGIALDITLVPKRRILEALREIVNVGRDFAGVDITKIKYVDAGWPTWGTALMSGQGDAALSWEGLRAQWKGQGLDFDYWLGRDFSKLPANSFVIRKADFEDASKKDMYERYFRGWAAGLEFGRFLKDLFVERARVPAHDDVADVQGIEQIGGIPGELRERVLIIRRL